MVKRKPDNSANVPTKRRKQRSVNMRRNRESTIRGFNPGDSVRTAFDHEKREFKLLIESENGIEIEHSKLATEA